VHIGQPKLINKKINLAMEDIGLVNPSKRDYPFFSNPHLAHSRIEIWSRIKETRYGD